jgi:1-acyl-sn-glycerol-3-phosphate acyltransferase
VYFANHTSHFDFVIIWAALPGSERKRTRAVAARDYWEKGRVRRYLAQRVFNVLLVDRARVEGRLDGTSLMAAALSEGQSLILFPEGTRGDKPEPVRFRSGLYNLAANQPDIDLVPVYIDNLRRIMPKGEVLPVPLLSSVTFGSPIRLLPDEGREDFLERAWLAVCELGR